MRFRGMRGAAPVHPRPWLIFGAGALALTGLAASAHAPADAPVPAARIISDGSSAAVTRPIEPSVFGTVALPAGTTPTSARWTRMMTARTDHPGLTRLAAGAAKLDRERQAAFVQAEVNRAIQRRAPAGCRGDDGYWAAAGETLTRGQGDCVDIAVAKMEALRRLGFAGQDLYLTTGRAAGGHKAALLVRIGDRFWLLDDRSERMIPADASAAFDPALTYGVGMTWAHGRRLGGASAGR